LLVLFPCLLHRAVGFPLPYLERDGHMRHDDHLAQHDQRQLSLEGLPGGRFASPEGGETCVYFLAHLYSSLFRRYAPEVFPHESKLISSITSLFSILGQQLFRYFPHSLLSWYH